METTEEIIEEYLRFVKGWFYLKDIKFRVTGEKGGSNYSNIDLIAIDVKKNVVYDIESKFRSVYTFPKSDIEFHADQLLGSKRTQEIRKLTNIKPIKVFVVTKSSMGSDKRGRREKLEGIFRNKMKRKGFKGEVWYFEDIITELKNKVSVENEDKGRYDSPILQTIRLLSKQENKKDK